MFSVFTFLPSDMAFPQEEQEPATEIAAAGPSTSPSRTEDRSGQEQQSPSFQNWYVSRKLSPSQTCDILYTCQKMVDGSVPLSRKEWDNSASSSKSGLTWRAHVYETVKSMKRKYNREDDKKAFQEAVSVARNTSIYRE